VSNYSAVCLIFAAVFSLVACPASSRADDHAKPAIILDAGEGEVVEFPLHPAYRLAGAGSNDAGMSFFEIQIPASSAGAPPHRHTHEDEFFYVREGTVTFMADDQRKTISAGGFVLLPRESWHAVWNSGDEDAILLVGTSAGKFDDFFEAVAMEVAAKDELSHTEIGAIVGRLGAERGVIIDMSLVPEDVKALYGLAEPSGE
jgi:quercetin dioxygenase-like cupin family protein